VTRAPEGAQLMVRPPLTLSVWPVTKDWALLYPAHFGVDPERIHANELNLIEVASGWAS